MDNSLLSKLMIGKESEGTIVKNITNKAYEEMSKLGNEIIREKQQKYYEAYNNASKVSIG